MRTRAVLFYVVGVAIYCAMDVVMKLLLVEHPATLATFWRYVSATLFTLGIWLWSGRPRITGEMLGVHLLRGTVVGFSALAFFWAMSVMPLVEVVTISFVAPLLVPPMAALLVKEPIRRRSLIAGGVGFLGVLVAAGITPLTLFGLQTPTRLAGTAAVLVAALLYALNLVLMRLRSAKDGASNVGLLGTIFPTLVLLPLVLVTVPAGEILPRADVWPLVFGVGLFGAIALQFLALAYQRMEAQVLAPFEYSALLWASLYGWLIFSEPVQPTVLLGAVLIAGACLWQMREASPVADRA